MEREEMFERLEAGEHPIDLSIRKWEDIVDGVGKDEGGGNCALCQKYDCYDNDYEKYDVIEMDVSPCPLWKYGVGCENNSSPWMNYHRCKVKRNAVLMLEALERVKRCMVENDEYWE